MLNKASRLRDYLAHIVNACERIERYIAGLDQTGFSADELRQDAVIRNLEIVGEACRNIQRDCPEFATAHPELPLSAAYQMRNAVAHGYFKVDLAVLWATTQFELPKLKQQVSDLLKHSN